MLCSSDMSQSSKISVVLVCTCRVTTIFCQGGGFLLIINFVHMRVMIINEILVHRNSPSTQKVVVNGVCVFKKCNTREIYKYDYLI